MMIKRTIYTGLMGVFCVGAALAVTAGEPVSSLEKFGEPGLDDGSDGFQYYENGGATGCYAFFTIKALYQLGRLQDACRIFHPMLAGYAAGDFQGFDASGRSKDWRD